MLIMAAAVAGFIWGLAYRFFPERLGAIIISHALWDCAVFIWFPIM
jgi:membrane protease YdiL (CAAX protease family)